MAEEIKGSLDIQIFHQLGQLGADQQSIIREIGNARTDVKERTDTIIKAVDIHLADDKIKFAEHHERLKVLEKWRYYILGLAGAITFAGWFWGVLK